MEKRNGVYRQGELDNLDKKQNPQIDNPEPVAPEENSTKKFNWLFWVWNIISVLGYVVFVFVQMRLNKENKQFYLWIILALVVYVAVFVIMMLCIKDNSKLKSGLKNYKTTAKILKKILQLYNLILSIILLIKSINTPNRIVSIVGSIFMGIVILVGLLIDVLTIVYRKKIDQTKARYSQMIKDNIKEFKE